MSLITPIKGKKILPRVARLFDTTRMQILLTLIVACFSQLDVVHQASRLDTLEDTREIKDLETQTQAFLSSVIQSILPVIGKAQMRLVTGLFGILLESDAVAIARTRVRGVPALTLPPMILMFHVAWDCVAHALPQSSRDPSACCAKRF